MLTLATILLLTIATLALTAGTIYLLWRLIQASQALDKHIKIGDELRHRREEYNKQHPQIPERFWKSIRALEIGENQNN